MFARCCDSARNWDRSEAIAKGLNLTNLGRRNMGNLFSKKPKVTQTDRAILVLKTQRRKLTAYQKQLDAVIVRELEVAKELLQQKKKDRALLILKRKKAQEELLKNVDVWILNVEQQLADIETAGRQKAVFESLKAGQKAVEDLQKEIRIEDIQKLMEESADAKSYQDQLADVLGQQLTDEDEEAVLAELENLELEMDMEELPEVPQQLPDVPATPVSPKKEPPRKERVPEDPIAEPSDGLTALLVRSDRSVEESKAASMSNTEEVVKEGESLIESSRKSGTDREDEDEELDLPSVPTSQVRIYEVDDSNSDPVPTRDKEEPVPAQ